MPKTQYGDATKINKKNRELLDNMINIIEDYEKIRHQITVRQVFYQMVARNFLGNTKNNYYAVGKLLRYGRMSGEIDWNTIVDRTRSIQMPLEFRGMKELGSFIKNKYRKCRWEDQTHYVMVMVEKEALAGILKRVTDAYHVPLLANKGYPSASFLYEAAGWILTQKAAYKKCHILYLGDHDPSGMHMPDDIKKRLAELDCHVDVERIALNMDQIKKYGLPYNKVKRKDSRSHKYAGMYGEKSWELDALDPKILADLLTENIGKYLRKNIYNKKIKEEDDEKKHLEDIVGRLESEEDERKRLNDESTNKEDGA